jgi:hypothetical protein
MTPDQQQALYRTLLDAFSSESDFERVVYFAFGQSLDRIAAGGTLEDRIFATVRWAAERGQVDRLLEAVKQERPDHPGITAALRDLHARRPVPVGTGGTPSRREAVHARGRSNPLSVSTPEQLMGLMNFVVVWMFCALPVLVVLYLVTLERAPWWAAIAAIVVVLPCGATFSRVAAGQTRSAGWPR